ncbi:unnamed protein product [Heligmosomoides polygyrus]|uniref:Ribosomal_L18e/L15P domain-containing protein n=1 Tax=Heligmosomoides polygyrus TaxID=6339 RepID=A0A183FF47_HELPZ|nr:unnamed protein product [Heligmosomoides polygyrus]
MKSYGTASYAISRHRKNKVFMWQSRVVHGRVYEFLVASRFKLLLLRCLKFNNLKIPLVLIDNDVIRENPDEPLNAPHFCKVRCRSSLSLLFRNHSVGGLPYKKRTDRGKTNKKKTTLPTFLL